MSREIICPSWCTTDHGDPEDSRIGSEIDIRHGMPVAFEIMVDADGKPFECHVSIERYESWIDGRAPAVSPAAVSVWVDEDDLRYASADDAEVIANAILKGVAALRGIEAS